MTKSHAQYLDNFKKNRIKASISIAGITFSVIFTFFLIGYFIDTVFQTRPYGIIISLVVSFPLVQIILFRILKKIFAKKA